MGSVLLSPSQLVNSQIAQWKQAIRQALTEARVAIPGILTSDIDPTAQTVSVQIAIQEQVKTQQGAKWMTIAPVDNVPVVLPRGGGWSFTLPLKKGDEGLLVFCDTCFDFWWQNGGVQNTIGNHRHEHWDCGFVPGMWSQPNRLSSYSTTSAQLRSDDGTVVVDLAAAAVSITAPKLVVSTTGDLDLTASGNVNITGAQVNIGNATKIDGKAFLTHQHTGVTTGGGDTGGVL